VDAYICNVESKNANKFLKMINDVGDTLPHLKRVKAGDSKTYVKVLIGTVDEFLLFLNQPHFVDHVFPLLKELMLPFDGDLIHGAYLMLQKVPKNRAYFMLLINY
jgi:hypothetical protein